MADANSVPAIERFRITRTLGASSRDGLYVAHDPLLDRQVSIRTLTNTAADAATRQALLEEARQLSRFRHTNIAPATSPQSVATSPMSFARPRTLAVSCCCPWRFAIAAWGCCIWNCRRVGLWTRSC